MRSGQVVRTINNAIVHEQIRVPKPRVDAHLTREKGMFKVRCN